MCVYIYNMYVYIYTYMYIMCVYMYISSGQHDVSVAHVSERVLTIWVIGHSKLNRLRVPPFCF